MPIVGALAEPPGAWALGAIVAWIASLVIIGIRATDSHDLDSYDATIPPDPPLVSVIVPARDEAWGVGRCVRSILDSRWTNLELILVDDHSTDATAAEAREAALMPPTATGMAPQPDPRFRLIVPPPLPEGWFGKQWACHAGYLAARGSLLCFTDADTRHSSELLPRSIAAMAARRADLFTVAGTQEMGTFWEKVVQPHVFMVLLTRYGSPERMSRSTRARDKIANGQFILARRDTYEAEGGHEAVRAHVAEDLRLAQTWTSRGRTVHMVHAPGQLYTRMYRSFGELWRGWAKNTFLGGRELVHDQPLLRAVFPLALPIAAFMPVLPIVALSLALAGVGGAGLAWFGLVATLASAVFWMGVYRGAGLSAAWGLTFPLAVLVFTGICVHSALRGRRVRWKDRRYDTSRH